MKLQATSAIETQFQTSMANDPLRSKTKPVEPTGGWGRLRYQACVYECVCRVSGRGIGWGI